MLPARYDGDDQYGAEGYVDPYLPGSGGAGGDRYGIGAVVYADADKAYQALLDGASPYAYTGVAAPYSGEAGNSSYAGQSYEGSYQLASWLDDFGINLFSG